jgi:hypothetical protein
MLIFCENIILLTDLGSDVLKHYDGAYFYIING